MFFNYATKTLTPAVSQQAEKRRPERNVGALEEGITHP